MGFDPAEPRCTMCSVFRRRFIYRRVSRLWFGSIGIFAFYMGPLLYRALAAETLLKLVFALSVTRTGSLILVPTGNERPAYVGGTDEASIATRIEQTIVGMTIDEFVSGAGMFGVFGSDGIVVVTPLGEIEAAGKIVALTVKDQKVVGGGRTQAAQSCSRFGLAIKVSDDGPISFFHNEELVLRTNG